MTAGGSINDRLAYVQDRIAKAARRAYRSPEDVKLLVVTKKQPIEKIVEVVDAGATLLGENYAEEAVPKITSLNNPDVKWHMIGHIQSRKAKLVSQYFSYVHSLDSLKLAQKLDRSANQFDRLLPVLLECNTSAEESKFGWDIAHADTWDRLLPEIEQILALPNLQVEGLMTMPPYTDQPETVRKYFILLRQFRDFLRRNFSQSEWNELSMGMSGDFEVAIEEGATWIRVGQLIMGPR